MADLTSAPISAINVVFNVLSFVGYGITLAEQVFYTVDAYTRDLLFYIQRHGYAGVLLASFGSRSIWQLQAEVINLNDEKIIFGLKKLVQEESEIVAIAASIIVQIAITALSLNGLSHAHWTARGSFVLSLISATLAVYSASTQYRTFCRCTNVKDVKERIKTFTNLRLPFLRTRTPYGLEGIPSVASVITISAPFALLELALHSFLVGFGIWLGFVWKRNLDEDATQEDSRAVFITYAVGLGTCYMIYSLSNLYFGPQQPLSKWVDELRERMQNEVQTKTPDHERYYRHERPVQHPQAPEPIIVSTSRPDSPNEEFSHALRKAAQLRRALAESEEHLASLYERLNQTSNS